jgi:NTP pyrophosphatase (non-canonical NTP hydrolase)
MYGFDEYQKWAETTVLRPELQHAPYFALEVCDEAGEIAGKVKKAIRDNGGVIDDKMAAEIGKEIGDVLWPLANLARVLGLSFTDIALGNVEKIQDRKARGVIGGSGDNR